MVQENDSVSLLK